MGIGFKEILLIILILLLLFGATKLPKALGGLGKGVHLFKKGMRGEDIDGEGPDGNDGSGPKT